MDGFKFISSLEDCISGDEGIHKIETSRGAIKIDINEDGIFIPFPVKIKNNLLYTSQLDEINLMDVVDESELIKIGYYTLEIKYIISEDEILLTFWTWHHYAPLNVVSYIGESNQN